MLGFLFLLAYVLTSNIQPSRFLNPAEQPHSALGEDVGLLFSPASALSLSLSLSHMHTHTHTVLLMNHLP